MKKLLCLVAGILTVISCAASDKEMPISDTAPAPAAPLPDPAYYSDWDSAIRYDSDMQNMYANTPTKIEKPIDMYMTMALALKYNYSGRMARYQENLVKAGKSTYSALPEIVSKAGYVNTNYSDTSPDLKVTWNILDLSTLNFMNRDPALRQSIATEESRKVIQNILQEARVLYWETLTAQRLLPVVNDTIEHITLDVDEMNVAAKELAKQGTNPDTEELVKKRKYMEAVQKLSNLKREMETAHERLASLMGLHPHTQFTLAGKEYGNFALPEIKSNLSRLEWLALTNRPELKVHDLLTSSDNLELIISTFRDDNGNGYKNNPSAYNQQWCSAAKEASMLVYENVRPSNDEQVLNDLRRQRMTSLILNQVYIAWARYMSSMEDYQIAMEIAGTSENIAEDITMSKGSHAAKSQLEAARAIADEVKASLAYVDFQDSLGALYATIGLDAVPYYMLNESPSKIAVSLYETLEKWRQGEFVPENRPYLMNIPSHRPPVNLSSQALLPDVTYGTGEHIKITIPVSAFTKMGWKEGDFKSKAGLLDDTSLPKWLKYNGQTREFTGLAMPGNGGVYPIKVYAMDAKNNIAYMTFKLTIVESYVPSMNVRGLNRARQATVMKQCEGAQCTDDTLDDVKVFAPTR
ncbi:MAG: hypothetical protein J6Y91_02035 [Alphaproteobacteria bacterium]|nr:hypothetical protein [Alphaproteobacteria bacterium]